MRNFAEIASSDFQLQLSLEGALFCIYVLCIIFLKERLVKACMGHHFFYYSTHFISETT
jgi:hypothetical protein